MKHPLYLHRVPKLVIIWRLNVLSIEIKLINLCSAFHWHYDFCFCSHTASVAHGTTKFKFLSVFCGSDHFVKMAVRTFHLFLSFEWFYFFFYHFNRYGIYLKIIIIIPMGDEYPSNNRIILIQRLLNFFSTLYKSRLHPIIK